MDKIFGRPNFINKRVLFYIWKFLTYDSLYPTGVSSSLTNIVHLSTGYNDVNYGDKILAVYFLPNTKHLRFDSDINANYGYSYRNSSKIINILNILLIKKILQYMDDCISINN